MKNNEYPKLTYLKKGNKNHKFQWIIFFVLLVIVGSGAYFAKKSMTQKEEQQGQEPQVVEKEQSVSNENAEHAIGPYGLWNNQQTKEEEVKSEETGEDSQIAFLQDFEDKREPKKVKGIYVSAAKVNNELDKILSLVEEKEINAIVLDIKDDEGYITYPMEYDGAIKINATKKYITNMEQLVKKLKENNVYLIARLVTFKDPVLAEERKDLALKNKDGTLFRDKDGNGWVNPYNKEVWEYLIGIAKECAHIGFDEVNFDYVRFSTDRGMANVDFGEEAENVTKRETITSFVKMACEQLKPLGIFVSADVYGAVIDSNVDAKIVGQDYAEVSKYLDYICPMIYPSHYGAGYYGIDYPDTKPYALIRGALLASKLELSEIDEEHRAIVRPWLQDFTASWLAHYIKYGPSEVRMQIDAVYDAGYEEWFLWNSSMKYTESALFTKKEAEVEFEKRKLEAKEQMNSPSVEETLKNNATKIKQPTKTPGMEKYIDKPWKTLE